MSRSISLTRSGVRILSANATSTRPTILGIDTAGVQQALECWPTRVLHLSLTEGPRAVLKGDVAVQLR